MKKVVNIFSRSISSVTVFHLVPVLKLHQFGDMAHWFCNPKVPDNLEKSWSCLYWAFFCFCFFLWCYVCLVGWQNDTHMTKWFIDDNCKSYKRRSWTDGSLVFCKHSCNMSVHFLHSCILKKRNRELLLILKRLGANIRLWLRAVEFYTVLASPCSLDSLKPPTFAKILAFVFYFEQN